MEKISFKSSLEQAILGIIDTGFPIFLINLSGGFLLALKAGLFQSILTFTMVFVNTSFFQFLYHKNFKLNSIFFPSLLTTFLSYSIHKLTLSPNPVYSAIFVLISALFYFSILYYCQKNHKTISIIKLYLIFINFLKEKKKIIFS